MKIPASDVIVIGSGPNGLAAAIVMAQAGLAVTVVEGAETIGGGARSSQLTLPGFTHDVCSAIYPAAAASPFFRTLPLARHGLEWIAPTAPLAHPLDDGSAVLEQSLDRTTQQLGADGSAYADLIGPLVEGWSTLADAFSAPLLPFAAHSIELARFGMRAIRPAASVARGHFQSSSARALFAGMAAHAALPLNKLGTSAFAMVLAASGHICNWPFPRGGAQQISNALASHLRELGGTIITEQWVRSVDELPPTRAILCDLTPRQLLKIAGHRFPVLYRKTLEHYRYGPAAFKVDYALSEPVPWTAAECKNAGTLHLGGTLEEMEDTELAVWRGKPPKRPFVLAAQHSLFDETRAPQGQHTLWTYCHLPYGSDYDMLSRLEAQIERFAPGFRDVVLARHVMPPSALEAHNPNLGGGDIYGGTNDIFQVLLRPGARMYATPAKGIYLCSASTPPGGGVHGMCGFYAAKLALKQIFGKRTEALG